MNADHTPSSYVSVGKITMATHNSSTVPMKGLTDKRNITLTFTISLHGDFLPWQIIYHYINISKGWKKAGVTDVINGTKELTPEDPFTDLDQLS